MTEASLDPELLGFLRQLKDRTEIEQVLKNFARAVDRGDWALLREVYHADAHENHGAMDGTIDDFIAYLDKRHEQIEQSQHYVMNNRIEFVTGTLAVAESYVLSTQRLLPGALRMVAFNDDELIVSDGSAAARQFGILRFVDRFEKRDSTWRIAERTAVSGDIINVQMDANVRFGPEREVQQRSAADFAYRYIEQLKAENV